MQRSFGVWRRFGEKFFAFFATSISQINRSITAQQGTIQSKAMRRSMRTTTMASLFWIYSPFFLSGPFHSNVGTFSISQIASQVGYGYTRIIVWSHVTDTNLLILHGHGEHLPIIQMDSMAGVCLLAIASRVDSQESIHAE